jgi:Protein of unknown function (DUF1592)/Protein of unknown function (DUF1588)/Protein of unknown function (DUF1585)/Protein of unknown function (DUF1595)/Protein of unknown function (DUF1587)
MRVNANVVAISALLLALGCGGTSHPEDAPEPSSSHMDAGTTTSTNAPESAVPSSETLSEGTQETEPDSQAPGSDGSDPSDPSSETEPSSDELGTSDDTSSADDPSESDTSVPSPTGTASEPEPVPDCGETIEPGESPLRRLSRVEYGNTLFQLFGDVAYQRLGTDGLVADGEALGFSNQASVLSTSPLLAGQYMDIATDVAEAHADDFDGALDECVAGPASTDCAPQLGEWVASFGQRVYRRPLTADEVAEYTAIYDWEVSQRAEHREGLKRVLETMLQSPHFLYRPEFGSDTELEAGVVQLSSWEMATRLSYLFWNTMPDVGLFEAAAADELRTPKQIETAARRLLKAPRARLAFRNFHSEWLNLQEVLNIRHNGKDLELFPDYEDALPPELYEETLQFLDYTVFDGDGSLQSVLTSPFTRMNQHTAAFYGIDGPTTDEFETVELDASRYAGILTHAGLLMAHSTRELSSPIHRGLFIRTNLLCQPPPPPPPNIPPPPRIDRSKTTREQYAAHDDNAACAGCHKLMDPIGLGFEHFDAMGRFRETEWEQPIDATGVIYQADPDEGWVAEAEFDGVVELGQALADSERVKQCVARQWYRFAMGRGEKTADACTMQQLDESFAASNYSLRELVLAIAKTPAFRSIHRTESVNQ